MREAQVTVLQNIDLRTVSDPITLKYSILNHVVFMSKSDSSTERLLEIFGLRREGLQETIRLLETSCGRTSRRVSISSQSDV